MDRIDRWKLADELNVYQIVLLIAGYDPSEFEFDHPDRWPREVLSEISAYLNAVKNAARHKRFVCHIEKAGFEPEYMDWENSLMEIESFKDWLQSRNFYDGYFLEDTIKTDPIADINSEFYAPKLAAAVRAWKEVTSNPEALNGKTPKQALDVWLRKHANEYELTGEDGNPNKLGIEEISKVANWKPAGGASRTPTSPAQPALGIVQHPRQVRPRPPTPKIPTLLLRPPKDDDDIPF